MIPVKNNPIGWEFLRRTIFLRGRIDRSGYKDFFR